MTLLCSAKLYRSRITFSPYITRFSFLQYIIGSKDHKFILFPCCIKTSHLIKNSFLANGIIGPIIIFCCLQKLTLYFISCKIVDRKLDDMILIWLVNKLPCL